MQWIDNCKFYECFQFDQMFPFKSLVKLFVISFSGSQTSVSNLRTTTSFSKTTLPSSKPAKSTQSDNLVKEPASFKEENVHIKITNNTKDSTVESNLFGESDEEDNTPDATNDIADDESDDDDVNHQSDDNVEEDIEDVKPNLSEKQSFECSYCGLSYSAQGSLQAHVNAKHLGIRHPCPECDYSTAHKGDLNKHIRIVHLKLKYQCPECVYKAGSKKNLRVHIQRKHEKLKYPCQFCDLMLSCRTTWKRHIQNIHSEELLEQSTDNLIY